MRTTSAAFAITVLTVIPSAAGQSLSDQVSRPEITQPERQKLPELSTTDRAELAQTAVDRALASREQLLERAKSVQSTLPGSTQADLLDRIGRLADASSFEGPQTGTGRLGESARTKYARTNWGLTVDRVKGFPGDPGSTPGGAGGNRTSGRPPEDPEDPRTSRDPRGPDDTIIFLPRGGNEIDVTLGKRIALIDRMRDHAIDIGDPGPLRNLNQREKNARNTHAVQVANGGTSGQNGRGKTPPRGPLDPRGKADSGFIAGMKGALERGRQKLLGR